MSISSWSVRHPVGVVMLTLAVMVLGGFALGRLNIDLLPHIIYPDVRVRILDPGVPAKIMEDEVTRQLEEQLADHRGRHRRPVPDHRGAQRGRPVLRVRQRHRLCAAGRQLPPRPRQAFPARQHRPAGDLQARPLPAPGGRVRGQLPPAATRWSCAPGSDYGLSRALLNLPGRGRRRGGRRSGARDPGDRRPVPAGGTGARRAGHRAGAAGRPTGTSRRGGCACQTARSAAAPGAASPAWRRSPTCRFPARIAERPLSLLRLGEVARVIDGAAEERLRIRLDDQPGIKLSIQKQPLANTVAVVDAVEAELGRLAEHGRDTRGHPDPPRRTTRRATSASRSTTPSPPPLSGALLAMAVVYVFLGSLRRTLHHRQRHSHRRAGDLHPDGGERAHLQHHDPGRAGPRDRHAGGQHHRHAGEHLPPPAPGRAERAGGRVRGPPRSPAPSSPPPPPTSRPSCPSCSSAVWSDCCSAS